MKLKSTLWFGVCKYIYVAITRLILSSSITIVYKEYTGWNMSIIHGSILRWSTKWFIAYMAFTGQNTDGVNFT